MQDSTVVFILFVLDWKYPFWTNLVQKIKIVSFSWNFGPVLIPICRMQWRCSLFLFFTFSLFLFKLVSLSWFLVPRLIWICRIQCWCVRFFRFGPETHFLGKFGPKNQNCQFKLKFGTYTNSNMQSSLMLFTFSINTKIYLNILRQDYFCYFSLFSEEVLYESRCSQKFGKIHRKTLVPESLFNKVAGEFCEIFKNTLYTEYQRTTAPGRS